MNSHFQGLNGRYSPANKMIAVSADYIRRKSCQYSPQQELSWSVVIQEISCPTSIWWKTMHTLSPILSRQKSFLTRSGAFWETLLH